MAVRTTLEQLEEVQTAITAVMSGQDITLDGKRIARANLDILHKREEILLARYKTEQGTGGLRVNVVIPKRL